MLIITFKELEESKLLKNPSATFEAVYEDDWFNDDLVKTMVKDIDKTDVIGPHLLQSEVLGPIAPSILSTGVKGLILMLCEKDVTKDLYFKSSRYGQNCFKWIFYISTLMDIKLYANSYFHLPKDLIGGREYKVYFEDYDYTTTNLEDIDDKIIEWS